MIIQVIYSGAGVSNRMTVSRRITMNICALASFYIIIVIYTPI